MSDWLSVNQIRQQERMRRSTVAEAMDAGELMFERRGRVRYARRCDVAAWQERRLARHAGAKPEPVGLPANLRRFV